MIRLAVNEIFGPTFQGEGPGIGQPVMFLRLAGCNLACSFCDTPYSWDWNRFAPKDEIKRMTVQEVANELSHPGLKSLVVSGGEPMLQEKALCELRLSLPGWWMEIETAGTIYPQHPHVFNRYTVSLKLENSENPFHKRIRPTAIEALKLTRRAVWKFVVGKPKDLDEVDDLVSEYKLNPVYIMPEGITAEKIIQTTAEIADGVIARGYNLTTRLQILTYGNRRAV